jgi:hypothetical protein
MRNCDLLKMPARCVNRPNPVREGLAGLVVCALLMNGAPAFADAKCLCTVTGSSVVVERARYPALDAATLTYGAPVRCRMTQSRNPQRGISIGLRAEIDVRARPSGRVAREPGRIWLDGVPGSPGFVFGSDYFTVPQSSGSLRITQANHASSQRLIVRVIRDAVTPANGLTTAYTVKSGSYIDMKYRCRK